MQPQSSDTLHARTDSRFNSAFDSTYNSNPGLQHQANNMSLYEPHQSFPGYPSTMMQDQEDNNQHQQRYPSPPIPMNDHFHSQIEAAAALEIQNMGALQDLTKEDSEPPSPGRSKPVPKPDREVTKGEDGRFVCNWNGCTEELKIFSRKCEWSKVSNSIFSRK